MGIVQKNTATAFGRDHGFSAVRSVSDYQRQVPVRGYSELEPYIDRAAAGEHRVLTADPAESFALSSGSTASSKRIPYTTSLVREFQRGISPWLAGLFLQYPALLLGRSYWQISPVGAPDRVSSGGMRIGFGKDSEYFGHCRGALVRAALAVPEEVAAIAEIDEFRSQTLRHLLACRNLRFVSIWNPSFLTLLLADLQNLALPLIERIRSDGLEKRAGELQHVFAEHDGADLTWTDSKGRTLLEAVWPKLRVISCWADAGAREAALLLHGFFPHVEIQPKGLIATEGLMSFPWGVAGHVLAISSHFFEFVDSNPGKSAGRPKLAHELETGQKYSVVLTTSGGLYRYRIGDLVVVTGWIGQCPLLRFCGKEDGVVDLVGEKLNGVHVTRAAEEVFARYGFHPRFSMLAPERSGPSPCYSLYVQSNSAVPDGVTASLDAALGENFHYAYARRLGQLAPLRLFLIDPESVPEADYLMARVAQGQHLGGIKRPQLDRNAGWSEVFKPASPDVRRS